MGNSIAFKDLIYDGQLIISANDIAQLFKNETVHIPFAKRLQKLQLRLLYLLEPYQQARTNEISESDIFDENDLTDNEKKTIIAQKVATEFESIKNDIAQMASFDVHQLYSDLFKNIASFTDSSTKMDYADLNNISTYTLDLLLTNTLNYEDIAPIVFLKTVFDNVNTTKAIKHIIIDEAQDYTAIQYEVFKNAFDHCNMTILGDLNQSMNAYMNIGSFDSIADTFNNQDTTSILLSKSYRSTKQIADFCNALLTKQNNAEQLNRHGCKPNVIKVARSSRPQKIVDQINIFQSKDYKLIAVICKTARDCQDLYNSISPYMDICLISNQKELYQGGVVIIPSYLAKGLEFDAVIVSSVDNDDFSKEEDRKLLYTVCTRALHELSLYYFDNLSRFIKEMDENLYVTNQSSID
jgi:DNA helicase-2/ATP-dependent DNA helicase PcrA